MKSFIKSLVLGGSLLFALSSFGQQYIASTNLTSASTNLLTIIPGRIYQLTLSAGSQNAQVTLYDNNVKGNTNISPAYIGYTNYTTNLASTYISALTGTTNIQTNSVIFGGFVTNTASTNLLPGTTYFVQANTVVTYPIAWVTTKGVVAVNDTNVAIALFYRGNTQ